MARRRYAKAILTSGKIAISEFNDVAKLGNYAAEVMAGNKAFNAWKVKSRVHPGNGMPCLIRRRQIINPTLIVSIEEVEPKRGFEDTHNHDPANFKPVFTVERGPKGLWRVPDGDSLAAVRAREAGLISGLEYPVYQDPSSGSGWGSQPGEKYVVVRKNEDGTEVKYYHKRTPEPAPVLRPGDGDDDDDVNDENDGL